jgi:hypothetical protein
VRLYVSAVVLTLAWFSVLNLAVSALAWLAGRVVLTAGGAGQRKPDVLFALRMAPATISTVFTLGVFLPVHWLYEGREGSEYFGVLLWTLAVLAVLLVVASASRVVAALLACRRLTRGWTVPVTGRCRIVEDTEISGMSLAGILRTTIVVGRRVRDALTCEELDVALAHEAAHRQAWDNVRRFALFASPDFLRLTRAGRDLEDAWRAELECLADDRAVEGDPARAADLASALLKVARLAAAVPGPSAGPLWSTFYEEALLELRVRRLVSGPPVACRPSWLFSAGSAAAAVGALALVWMADVPRTVHFMTEVLVQLLP